MPSISPRIVTRLVRCLLQPDIGVGLPSRPCLIDTEIEGGSPAWTCGGPSLRYAKTREVLELLRLEEADRVLEMAGGQAEFLRMAVER
jgi:hypothetical protein